MGLECLLLPFPSSTCICAGRTPWMRATARCRSRAGGCRRASRGGPASCRAPRSSSAEGDGLSTRIRKSAWPRQPSTQEDALVHDVDSVPHRLDGFTRRALPVAGSSSTNLTSLSASRALEVGALVLVPLAEEQLRLLVLDLRPLELARATRNEERRQVTAGEVGRHVGGRELECVVRAQLHALWVSGLGRPRLYVEAARSAILRLRVRHRPGRRRREPLFGGGRSPVDPGRALYDRAFFPDARQGAEPHYHREHSDSFYVLEGELAFLVHDEEHVLGPGACACAPPGVVHGFGVCRPRASSTSTRPTAASPRTCSSETATSRAASTASTPIRAAACRRPTRSCCPPARARRSAPATASRPSRSPARSSA